MPCGPIPICASDEPWCCRSATPCWAVVALRRSTKCCRIRRRWPSVPAGWRSICLEALQLPTSSTAEAARMVVGSRFRAAIASRQAGLEHGLPELAFPVNDVAGNRTRFLLLERGERRQVGDVASLAFSLHRNAGCPFGGPGLSCGQGLNMVGSNRAPRSGSSGSMSSSLMWNSRSIAPKALEALVAGLSPLCEHLAHFGAYPSSELIND